MKKIVFIYILMSAYATFSAAGEAQAATIIFKPEKIEAMVGQPWAVDVVMKAETQINAIEGNIYFSEDMLKVQAIYTGNSGINMWIEGPEAVKGVINFSGMTPGGIAGEARQLFRVVFVPRRAGKGIITGGGAAFKNDGSASREELHTASLTIISVEKKGAGMEEAPYRIKDMMPPEKFVLERGRDESMSNNKWFIAWNAYDKQSGIARYEVQEMRSRFGANTGWALAESPYVLRDQSRGSYVAVKAIDEAGNERVVVLAPEKKNIWYNKIIIWIALVGFVFLGARCIMRLRPQSS